MTWNRARALPRTSITSSRESNHSAVSWDRYRGTCPENPSEDPAVDASVASDNCVTRRSTAAGGAFGGAGQDRRARRLTRRKSRPEGAFGANRSGGATADDDRSALFPVGWGRGREVFGRTGGDVSPARLNGDMSDKLAALAEHQRELVTRRRARVHLTRKHSSTGWTVAASSSFVEASTGSPVCRQPAGSPCGSQSAPRSPTPASTDQGQSVSTPSGSAAVSGRGSLNHNWDFHRRHSPVD